MKSFRMRTAGAIVAATVVAILSLQACEGTEPVCCALTRSNAIYCWGLNDAGQLGDGTAVDRAIPVRVAGQP